MTGEAGISDSSPGYGMTAVATDLDGDSWVDLYVACDGTPSLLFRNLGDGTFQEEGLERGAALSEDAIEQAGMGEGIGDYDLDGDLDLFKTHFPMTRTFRNATTAAECFACHSHTVPNRPSVPPCRGLESN